MPLPLRQAFIWETSIQTLKYRKQIKEQSTKNVCAKKLWGQDKVERAKMQCQMVTIISIQSYDTEMSLGFQIQGC